MGSRLAARERLMDVVKRYDELYVSERPYKGSLHETVLRELASEIREECAKACEPKMGEILLACGEMTMEQQRLVRAVLNWRANAIRALGGLDERST